MGQLGRRDGKRALDTRASPAALERAPALGSDGGAVHMLATFRKKEVPRDALDRVKSWTRERFDLPEDAPVFVSEVACGVPGCPPLETVVAFWTDAGKRHHFKLFKPVNEIAEEDLPPRWMKNALVESEIFGCECC